MTDDDLKARALDCGASGAGLARVADIMFREEFRPLCEANRCGHYGRSWMCPPAVGEIGRMIASARTRQKALVFMTIGELKDSFDYRGMVAASKGHAQVSQAVAGQLAPDLENALLLGAGPCPVCEKCAQPDREPCRFPEKAFASLEAHGVAVSELAKLAGLSYVNGRNSVTYFGALLFGRENS